MTDRERMIEVIKYELGTCYGGGDVVESEDFDDHAISITEVLLSKGFGYVADKDAEIERLKAALGECEDEVLKIVSSYSAFESMKESFLRAEEVIAAHKSRADKAERELHLSNYALMKLQQSIDEQQHVNYAQMKQHAETVERALYNTCFYSQTGNNRKAKARKLAKELLKQAAEEIARERNG